MRLELPDKLAGYANVSIERTRLRHIEPTTPPTNHSTVAESMDWFSGEHHSLPKWSLLGLGTASGVLGTTYTLQNIGARFSRMGLRVEVPRAGFILTGWLESNSGACSGRPRADRVPCAAKACNTWSIPSA